MYNKYLELKQNDNNKLYLFKSGVFYIFIEDDAININKYVNLKLTNLDKKHIKCGFPISSYDKYMTIFNKLNLIIDVVDDISMIECDDDIISKLKDIDINNLNNALDIIKRLKDKYE